MTSVGNADVIEYEIETGQTKTKVEYTTPGQVLNVLEGYERFRQMYVNKLIPRVVSLRDQRNFRRG